MCRIKEAEQPGNVNPSGIPRNLGFGFAQAQKWVVRMAIGYQSIIVRSQETQWPSATARLFQGEKTIKAAIYFVF